MSNLREALLTSGLGGEPEPIEVPETGWERCEITGVPPQDLSTYSNEILVLNDSKVGVWHCAQNPRSGTITLKPYKGLEDQEKRETRLLEALQRLQSLHPGCEILWF